MQIANPLATFTRPADTTAYASGDLVANSTTAGSVVPLTFNLGNTFPQNQFRLTRVRIYKTGTSAANASFRLHLYEASPTVTNGDNGAWLSNKFSGWLGNVDVTSMLAFSDGCAGTGSAVAGSELLVRATTSGPLYGLLEARAAYTPASAEAFTVVLEEMDSY